MPDDKHRVFPNTRYLEKAFHEGGREPARQEAEVGEQEGEAEGVLGMQKKTSQ